MSRRSPFSAFFMLLVLAGCGEPGATGQETARLVPTPEATAEALPVVEHTGFGTVNSVDRAAGIVNISHAAVASAGWPAMVMDFKVASPATAAKLRPGQRIEFRFTTTDGGTVTAVEPLP